jgi:cellulose synthase (UDP-forming)
MNKTNTYSLLIILTIITVLVYLVVRLVLFLFTNYQLIEKFFAVLLLLAESFILVHSLGYIFNIFNISKKDIRPSEEISIDEESEQKPGVAILVAARHEPKAILRDTFLLIKSIDYKNKQVYFLDDSSLEEYKKEAEELAEEFDLILFRRKERRGAKAGIINDCLKNLTQKYVVVFDADQNPMPGFLNELVSLMEKDEKLAFIQTPQFYSNIEESNVARGAAFQQAVFYEYICEGKSSSGSMFCCGTNIIFRREALKEVGGFDESSVTEDFATSVKFHIKGFKSLYYNHVSTFGMGPIDLKGYFRQQFRWATGTISVLKKIIWRFITRPFSLKPVQWWEYFLSGSYYLAGLAFFVLMICPIAYLFLEIPSFFIKPEIYILAFIPYITLSMTVFYMVLGKRHYKIKDLFLGQLLGILSFSVYIRGAVSALLGIKTTFGITGKIKSRAIPYIKLWPQMIMIFLNFIAVIWGVNRFIYEREIAVLINGFWALYHFMVLSSIFYFNEER